MPETRHDTDKMSLDEIRALVEAMPRDSTAPPPPVVEAIIAAQCPDAVSCPDCGRVFVPGASSADDGPDTMVDGTEQAARIVTRKT